MPLRIDFLNVGHGDCTVIMPPSGRLTVIDINNAQSLDETTAAELAAFYQRPGWELRKFLGESEEGLLKEAGYDIELADPIAFLDAAYPNRPVFRYVQTHPHFDHMRGLARLVERRQILNFWDTTHFISEPDYKTDADREDWQAYLRLRSSTADPLALRLIEGSRAAFYNQGTGLDLGDGIHIVAPRTHATLLTAPENPNDLSYVLSVTHAGYRVILGGDAGTAVLDAVAERYGSSLRCHAYKASHHGRDSGYSAGAMERMSPTHTIVSVGKKPSTDASNKYRQSCNNVWSTRWLGNITLVVQDNGYPQWTVQHPQRLL